MKYILTYIFVLLSICNVAQNLVPNPSFELHSSCPNASGQINFVNFWSGPGTSNTPDYYNACATNVGLSVPYRIIYDYQGDASTGNAFVGIWVFSTLGFVRETIQAQLTQTLSLNSYYYFKMKINLHNYARFAVNNVGAIITTNTTVPLYNTNISTTPVLYEYNNPIVRDTLNWTTVEAIYKATGGEKYLSIGNFFNDNYTDTISVSSQYPYSYYFIDDVSVEAICTPFWNYRDTTVTIGDSVLIGPAITGLDINWYDATSTLITNAPGIYVKPAITSTYTAVEDFCGTTYTNNIVVTVLPTGVRDISYELGVMSLVPNPTNGLLTINCRYDFEKVELTTITGQVLFTETVNNKTHQLQLQNFAEGIYFVKVSYANGQSITKKVIVNN